MQNYLHLHITSFFNQKLPFTITRHACTFECMAFLGWEKAAVHKNRDKKQRHLGGGSVCIALCRGSPDRQGAPSCSPPLWGKVLWKHFPLGLGLTGSWKPKCLGMGDGRGVFLGQQILWGLEKPENYSCAEATSASEGLTTWSLPSSLELCFQKLPGEKEITQEVSLGDNRALFADFVLKQHFGWTPHLKQPFSFHFISFYLFLLFYFLLFYSVLFYFILFYCKLTWKWLSMSLASSW